MEEEPAEGGRAGPRGRLDLTHGFLQHIRRNQIARDDYDKEVKEATEKQKPRRAVGPSRPKKPDQPVYRPRQAGGSHLSRQDPEESGSSSATELDPPETALFCLEYEDDDGEITAVTVYKEDDPEVVAAKICSTNRLDPLMRHALKQRIREEMAKRRMQR